uniref:GAG-pre-integrase domain-containing protein n=1 Tax=Nymphaea colorata TaxID=210225 RepID=A0A5K0UXE8_9MAGN
MDDDDLVICIMAGVPPGEYRCLRTALKTRVDPITLEDLLAMLLIHESQLDEVDNFSIGNSSVNFTMKNQNFGGNCVKNKRGHTKNQDQSLTNQTGSCFACGNNGHIAANYHTVSQVCHQSGHGTLKCKTYKLQKIDEASSMEAHAADLYGSFDHGGWYRNSRATHHDILDFNNLTIQSNYNRGDQFRIGNGQGLNIKHIGTSVFSHIDSKFIMKDILHMSSFTKNLISVYKFTKDKDVLLEFHPQFSYLKDAKTGHLLLKGNNERGLYKLNLGAIGREPAALLGEQTTRQKWLERLAHPSMKIMQYILYEYGLPSIFNKFDSLCEACQMGKSHTLPFSSSIHEINGPLELIYIDVWGSVPIASMQGYYFYINFVDGYSRFTC